VISRLQTCLLTFVKRTFISADGDERADRAGIMDIEIFDNVPIIDYSIPAISGVYPEKKNIYISTPALTKIFPFSPPRERTSTESEVPLFNASR